MGLFDLRVVLVAERAPTGREAANEGPVFSCVFRESLGRQRAFAPRAIKCMLEQVEGLDAAVHGVDDGGGHSPEV